MMHVFILSFVASMLWTAPAYAYVDPGTAGLLLQGLIGGLAVLGIFFREKVAMVFRFLKTGKLSPDKSPGASENAGDAQ